MSSLKEIRELLVSQARITTFLRTSLLLNTFQNTFSRENGCPAPSMSSFEVQDFQKRKLKVIKKSQIHIFRALGLLAGLWVLKDTLNLRQNRSNWFRNKYTRWKLLAPGFGVLSQQCISLLILSLPTLLSELCVFYLKMTVLLLIFYYGNFLVVLATSLGSDSNYVGRECSTCSTSSAALEFVHFDLFFLYTPIEEF